MSFWDGRGLCEKLCGLNLTQGVEGYDLGGRSIKSGNWRVGIESPPGPNNLINEPVFISIVLILFYLLFLI